MFSELAEQMYTLERDERLPAERREALLDEMYLRIKRCRYLVWGLDDLSERQAIVLSTIEATAARAAGNDSDDVEQVIYAVCDMSLGMYSGIDRYKKMRESQEDMRAIRQAVHAFAGFYSEPGRSKWDIINEFLARHDLGSKTLPEGQRRAHYKHPLLKVRQEAARRRKAKS